MRRLRWPLAVVLVPALLGAAGLLLVRAPSPAPAVPPRHVAALSPAATPASATPRAGRGSARPRPSRSPGPATGLRHGRAGPWSVVAAYYRDINARRYARAWALIRSGLATGQTYQQFVGGYACTGAEHPARLGRSGHQVTFRLTVVNDCTGATSYYTGTDTVYGGKIVAAHVTPTG